MQSKSPSKANFSSFWSRSGGRRRRASLMLKFRKIEIIWLKSRCFPCANSRNKSNSRISIFREEKKGRKCCLISRQMRHSVHVQLREPDQCATGENTKKASASTQRNRPGFLLTQCLAHTESMCLWDTGGSVLALVSSKSIATLR